MVPSKDSGRVVDTENVDLLDLEADLLKLLDDPVKGDRGVGSGEDVLVHEETFARRERERRSDKQVIQSALAMLESFRFPKKQVAEQLHTPDEILELPHGSDTSNLEHEDSIVVQEVVNLPEERRVLPDTDVLLRDWRVKGKKTDKESETAKGM